MLVGLTYLLMEINRPTSCAAGGFEVTMVRFRLLEYKISGGLHESPILLLRLLLCDLT